MTETTLSPYLHYDEAGAYNPLTGKRLEAGSPELEAIKGGVAGLDSELRERLTSARFLVDDVFAESRRFSLFCVSLETCSVCNHRCGFCPVSIDPREAEVMEPALFERIVDEIAGVATDRTIVFLNNYNEPTVDPHFEDRCTTLFARKLPVALLTNASGLTPEVARRLAQKGRFRYLGINLPTLEAERYREMHGTKDLARVLKNVDALAGVDLAEEKVVVALGNMDETHTRNVEALRARFEPQGLPVRQFPIRSRAGQIGTVLPPPKKKLRGCDQMGSRPFEHLHITASATAVLCCQDYYEKWVIGDLKTQSVAEVLGGDRVAQMRRWAYGVEEAPDEFLCRRCEFALGE